MLLDRLNVMPAFGPQDLSLAANTGEWVSLHGYRLVVVLFQAAAGTAGQDPVLTLEQAKDVSGTDAKALDFAVLYRKQGADLTAIGMWTKIVQATANTYTNGTAAEDAELWAVEVAANQLDAAGGFVALRASVADTGADAQIGHCLYLLGEPKARSGPEFLASPLLD